MNKFFSLTLLSFDVTIDFKSLKYYDMFAKIYVDIYFISYAVQLGCVTKFKYYILIK